MITQPLELANKLRPSPRDNDVFYWANGALIGLFFALLGSRFVLAPGMPLKVGESADLDLPHIGAAVKGVTSVVVSYRRDGMLLFEGGIFDIREIRAKLTDYAKAHPGAVLLVRVDKQVSMQGFLALCDLAREVGYANVLVAAESAESDALKFVPSTR